MTQFDAATGEIVSSVEILGNMGKMALGEGGLWVADCARNTVHRIDASLSVVTASIAVGQCPAHIAAGGGFVWTTNFEDGTISRIDPTTNMAVAFDVGEEPTYLAVGSFEVTHGGTNVVVYADPEPGATGQEPPKIQNTLSFNAHVKGIADAFGKLAILLDDGRLLHYDRESGVTTEGMGPGVPSSGLAFGDGHLIVYAPTDDTILVSGPGPDKSWVSRGNFHPAAFAAYDNVLYVTGGNGDVLSDPLSGRPNTRVIGHVPPPAANVIVAPKTPDQGGNEAVASPEVLQSVPPAILGDALQNPQHIAGWGQPINPNLPAGPNNPPGRVLRLWNPSLAYDSVSNRILVYGGLAER